MRVVELWRYPVKSLQGEAIPAAQVAEEGLVGDRRYALVDVATGLGLTARRVPQLLYATARLLDSGAVEITLPDGSVATDDDALSAWLDRPVALRSAEADAARRYENVVDFEHEPVSAWETFEGSPGAFHDSAGARVSLLSRTSIDGWPARRFRANVLLDGGDENTLVGSRVRLGGALLDVGMRLERCVMVTRPQPDGIERDLDVLRRIHRERDSTLAVGALVQQAGPVRVGDEVRVEDAAPVG